MRDVIIGLVIRDGLVLALLLSILLAAASPIPLGLPFGVDTTWGVARILIGVVFLGSIFLSAPAYKPLKSPVVIPIFLYFLANLASLIPAVNLDAGGEQVMVWFTGILFFFSAASLFQERKHVVWLYSFALLAGIGVSLVSFYALLYPDAYAVLSQGVLDQNIVAISEFDRERGRIFPLWDIELLLGGALFLFLYGRGVSRVISVLALPLISLAVFITNTRYRFVVWTFGLLGFMFLTRGYKRARPLLLSLAGLFLIYLSLSGRYLGEDIISRFLLRNQEFDVESLQTRADMAWYSAEMFSSSPLLGVGTNNYFEYYPYQFRQYEIPELKYFAVFFGTFKGPHNWLFTALAETGLFGFFALLWMLFSFLRQDVSLWIRHKGLRQRALLASLYLTSWGFVLGSMAANLVLTMSAVILFFIARGVITSVGIGNLKL